MSSRSRAILNVNLDAVMANDPLRELFEACKTGDIAKVKKLITPQTVNARDTAGRKSTPLHFAAGKCASSCPLSSVSSLRTPDSHLPMKWRWWRLLVMTAAESLNYFPDHFSASLRLHINISWLTSSPALTDSTSLLSLSLSLSPLIIYPSHSDYWCRQREVRGWLTGWLAGWLLNI